MAALVRKLALIGWLLATVGQVAAQAQTDCPEGNLLEGATPHSSYDAYHEQRLTDGFMSPEGAHWMNDTNALLTAVGYVVYRLERTTTINSLVLQADSNDSYRVGVSLDGESWKDLGVVPVIDAPGMRTRYAAGFDVQARYLKISPGAGDGAFSVGEFAAYCGRPEPWPPQFPTREGLVRDANWSRAREKRLAGGKIAVGLVGGVVLCLIVSARRRGKPWPRRIERASLLGVVALSALAWINFGSFHGPNVIHHHEMFHYVIGSKYFPENRYTLLYHCAELAEAESGRRAFVERRVIRNLATNELEPASVLLADPGPCREAFSAERWDSFARDVEFIRRHDYPGSWGRIFLDHGYNATPVWGMLGGWVTNLGSASRRLGWLAGIDALLYLGMGLLIAWAFGLESCALAALMWGVGFPWQYYWTGGAFARAPWLFLAVAAVCLLRRSRFGSAGVALAGTALLRVFPALLSIGPAIFAAREWARAGRPAKPHVRMFAGAALAALLLVSLSVWAGGLSVWSEFGDNLNKHVGSPLANHIGLPTLFAWSSANTQQEVLSGELEGFARWEQTRRATFASRRAFYWPVALGLMAFVALFAARFAAAEWETVSASTLLVFALLESASYYLVFFVLLAPLAAGRRRRIALLALGVTLSQLAQFTDASVDTKFFGESLLFLVLSVGFLADLMWERRAKA